MDKDANTVRVSGRLICQSARDVEIVQEHLAEHMRQTLAEPGCLAFSVVQSDDPLIWIVQEAFRDAAAFYLHQSRARASVWWAATAGIARDYTVVGTD